MADESNNRRENKPSEASLGPAMSGRRPGPNPTPAPISQPAPPPSMRRGAVEPPPAPGVSKRMPQTQVVTPVAVGGPPRRPVYRPRGMSISTKVILAMAGLAAIIVAAMFIVVRIQTAKAVNETINQSGVGYVQLLGAVGQEYRDGLTERSFLQSLQVATDAANASNSDYQGMRDLWRVLLDHYRYNAANSKYHPAAAYATFDELLADLEWMHVAERCETTKMPAENRTKMLGAGWEAAVGDKKRGPRKLTADFGDANWKPEAKDAESTYARLVNTMRPDTKIHHRRLADLAVGLLEFHRAGTTKRLGAVTAGGDSAQVVGISYDPGVATLDFLARVEVNAASAASPVPTAEQQKSRLMLSVGVSTVTSPSGDLPTRDAGVSYSEGYGELGQSPIQIRAFLAKQTDGGSIRVFLNSRELGEAQASAMAAISVISVVALFLAVGVAFLVGRGLTKPVRGLMDDVQEIAAGNFAHMPTVRTRDEVGTLAQLLAEMAGSLKVAQELWRTTQAQAHDLDMAREIQENLLAKNVPVADGYDISAYYQPSKEVGGDYYDFFMVEEGKIGMVVADVSGKGVPGSMIMMMAKALITYQAIASHASPKALFSSVNKFLARDIKRGMFVTAFYIELDVPKRITRVASAGHCPMLIFREATQKAFSINPGGLALGFDREGALFERNMKEEAIQLQPGDRVMIYTDGITEAKNAAGEEFGEQRVQQIMARCSGYTSKDFLVQLVRAIEAHAQTDVQGDDITVVTFRVV